MDMRFELSELQHQIETLLVQFPELADDEQLRADTFEGETDINAVLAKLVDMSQEAASMADAIKARAAELTARRTRYENKEDAMRSLIRHVMDKASLTKVTLPEATLSIAFRKPAPVITDEAALPPECLKTITKPDMTTIKAWVEAGNIPDGVAMGNGTTSLTIRTK